MRKSSGDMPVEQRPHMRDGDGTVTLAAAFTPGEFDSRVRLFSRITLPAGASIGRHLHENEEEFFYFLSGTGEFDDDGTILPVGAGDATVTRSGQAHSLRNTGASPLELLAVIVRL